MAIIVRMYFLAGSLIALAGSLECADQAKVTQQPEQQEIEIKRSKALAIAKAAISQVHSQTQQASSPSSPQASPGTSPENSQNSSAQPSPNGSPLVSPGSSPESPRHQAQRTVEAILHYEWPFIGSNKMLSRIDSPVNYVITSKPIPRQGSARELSNFFPGK